MHLCKIFDLRCLVTIFKFVVIYVFFPRQICIPKFQSSQKKFFSKSEAGLLTGRPGLYKGGQASTREAGPLARRQGL